MKKYLLQVQNVSKVFGGGFMERVATHAVNDVSLALPGDKPQILAIAGESGSGKTTLGQMVLGLTAPSSGRILFDGKDIQHLARREHLTFRREVQAIFQNPFDVFNPVYRVDHVFNLIMKQFGLARDKGDVRKKVTEALGVVRLNADEVLGRYAYELSGGQLQRIMIARAFVLKPRLIVADEPVSMVDASLRAIILDIMVNLKNEFGISQLYITHDLSTALQVSDEILIMHQGAVVERGDAEEVIQSPKHAYTKLLVDAIPLPDPDQKWVRSEGTATADVTASAPAASARDGARS